MKLLIAPLLFSTIAFAQTLPGTVDCNTLRVPSGSRIMVTSPTHPDGLCADIHPEAYSAMVADAALTPVTLGANPAARQPNGFLPEPARGIQVQMDPDLIILSTAVQSTDLALAHQQEAVAAPLRKTATDQANQAAKQRFAKAVAQKELREAAMLAWGIQEKARKNVEKANAPDAGAPVSATPPTPPQ